MDLSIFDEQLSRLQLKKYERKVLKNMPKPTMLDIKKELQILAKLTLPEDQIEQFVIDNAAETLRTRLRSYEAAQSLYSSIENLRESEQNKVYYEEYLAERNKIEAQKEFWSKPYDPIMTLPSYNYPDTSLFNEPTPDLDNKVDYQQLVVSCFELMGFPVNRVDTRMNHAYSYTTLSLQNQETLIKVRKKAEEIEANLHPCSRVIAPIPGTTKVGVEIPISNNALSLRHLFESEQWNNSDAILPIALGEKADGQIEIIDLDQIGNLLIMGRDNHRISIAVESLMTSLFFRVHPSKLAFVVLDSSGFNYSYWKSLSHLYLGKDSSLNEAIVQNENDFPRLIGEVLREVNMRTILFGDAMVRDIRSYNEKFCSRSLPIKLINVPGQHPSSHQYLSDVVVIIDNISSIIESSDQELIKSLQLIANRAKDTGVHLVCVADSVSRKRSFIDLLTFFNNRLLMKLSDRDSYSMLSNNDASRLEDSYDAIWTDGFNTTRIYVPEIQTDEHQKLFAHFSNQPHLPGSSLILPSSKEDSDFDSSADMIDLNHLDSLFEEAAEMVVATGQASTSMIQRKFQIGYNRCGRIMDQMEAAGIVGPYTGSKARAVLVDTDAELQQILTDLKKR